LEEEGGSGEVRKYARRRRRNCAENAEKKSKIKNEALLIHKLREIFVFFSFSLFSAPSACILVFEFVG
jgi:hypothetical protein